MAKGATSTSLLNTREAARFLRVSQASVRRWSDSGLLAARRVGRRRERRFAEADLQRFLGQPISRPQPAPTSAPAAAHASSAINVGGQWIPIRSHLAPIYGTDHGGLRLSVPFLADGLRAGQHCFLAATGDVLARYVKALTEEQGIDFGAAIASGRLAIVAWPGASVADAIASWESLFGSALAGGPTVMRVVGEMSCEREMFASDAEMMVYEEAYDLMVRRYPAVTLCQYDARLIAGELMLRMLKAHPDMFAQHLGGLLN
jgi:excisionase family DNA binding protein